jgi:single-strand DNA-binding protein
MSLNQVQLIGNVGSAPEVLKKTEKGAFVRFSIATNKQFTNRQGETIQKVQWHKVMVNNGLGTFVAAHLKKGMRLFVSGELNYDEWTDKNGQERETTSIFANRVDFLSALDKKKPKKNEASEAEEESGVTTDE